MVTVTCVTSGLLLVPGSAAAVGWFPAVDLSTSSEISAAEPGPEIAMDAGGGAVAVWQQFKGLENVQAASMTPVGTWGPAIDLAPGVHDQRAPQVAMNGAGEAVAVWEQLGEQTTIVATVRTPTGEWGPPETLSPGGSVFGGPEVAVGPSGEAVAVWSEVPRFGPGGGYRIEGAFKPEGGRWDEPVALSEPGDDSYGAQVAITPEGKAVATWYGYYGAGNETTVQVAEDQGGDWSRPKSLSAGYSAWSPKVEAGVAGAVVIWESEGGWVEASSQATGGEWGRSTELSGPESIEPQIGGDAEGDAIAIWSSGYGEEGEYIESSTLPAGGDWSESTEVSGPLLVERTEPRLAVAADGGALTTWSTWSDHERSVEEALGFDGEWEEPVKLSPAGTRAVRAAVALDGRGDGAVAWWAADPYLPQATEFVTPQPGAVSTGDEIATPGGPSSVSGSKEGPALTARAVVHRLAFVRKGRAYVELRCLGGAGCEGDLRLVTRVTGKHGKAVSLLVGGAHFAITAEGEETVIIRLSKRARRLLSVAGTKGIGVRAVGREIEGRHLLLRSAAGRSRPD